MFEIRDALSNFQVRVGLPGFDRRRDILGAAERDQRCECLFARVKRPKLLRTQVDPIAFAGTYPPYPFACSGTDFATSCLLIFTLDAASAGSLL